MISISERHRTIIQEILSMALPNCEVLAFGSRLSSDHAQCSDLDLAVIGPHRFSLLQLYELQEKFAESVLPFRVDIVDWNAVSPDFQKVIASRFEKLQ